MIANLPFGGAEFAVWFAVGGFIAWFVKRTLWVVVLALALSATFTGYLLGSTPESSTWEAVLGCVLTLPVVALSRFFQHFRARYANTPHASRT